MADERAIAAEELAHFLYPGTWWSGNGEVYNKLRRERRQQAREAVALVLAALPGDDTARALDEVERRVRVMFLGEQPSESEDWQGKFGGLVNRPAVVMRVERIIREVRAAHAAHGAEAGR